jgi:hypothetical protein
VYLVPIGHLEPGQIVARAVTNSGGAILCPPGLALTQAIIDRLSIAGIDHVAVKGSGVEIEHIQQRLDALEARCRGLTDPLSLQLKNLMECRLRAMLADSGT